MKVPVVMITHAHEFADQGLFRYPPPAILLQNANDVALMNIQIRLSLAHRLGAKLIRFFVALGARRADAGSFVGVSMRHWIAVASVLSPMKPPSASISLTMCPFANPPHRGVAGHLADRIHVLRKHDRLATQARRSHRGFDTGMAGADYDGRHIFLDKRT